MRLAATSSPLARRRQAGLGTLLVAVVLLLLVMVLIATVSRTMVVEQRMSANQVRAKQAHEAAQAGIDAAMTFITTGVGGTDRNGDNIADDLASVTLSTGASYRAAFFDILPALKSGDSCCQTAMPRRENVFGRVHVAVVYRSAFAANPFSYSKSCSTFRTAGGNNPAARASLG